MTNYWFAAVTMDGKFRSNVYKTWDECEKAAEAWVTLNEDRIIPNAISTDDSRTRYYSSGIFRDGVNRFASIYQSR